MAVGLKNIKIKISGDADGLDVAARRAKAAIDKIDKAAGGLGGKIIDKLGGLGQKLVAVSGKLGQSLNNALGSAMEALPPQGKILAGVLVSGLAVTLAPALGAAVASAVLLVAGGGVLAAGIAAVAKTPKVAAAFSKLKDSLFDRDTSEIEAKIAAAQERFLKAQAMGSAKGMKSAKYDIDKAKAELTEALDFNKVNKSFKDMFTPFIAPLERLAGTLTSAFDKAKPAIERMAAVLAPVIDKLSSGVLEDFGKNALPGIEAAVAASVPLFLTLADKLPMIGQSVGTFFDKIAASGPDANVFFSDFLDLVGGTIVAFGTAIGWLASFYTAVRDHLTASKVAWINFKISVINVFDSILGAAESSLGWIPGLDSKLAKARGKFAQFRNEANAELAMIKSRYEIVILARYKEMGFKSPSPGQFTGRASGGPVGAGRTYLVGERGPEVITMGGNGWVTPNRDLDAGGDTIEVHVHLADDVTRVVTARDRDLKRRARARKRSLA